MTQTRTLAFEIGVEEIPAFDLVDAVKQLEKKVPGILDEARIPHGEVQVFDSPRRLIVLVSKVADKTEAETEVFKGPAVKIAFDESGAPTKAAEGFARGKGLTVDDLYREEQDGTEYVFAKREVPEVQVATLLPGVLESIIKCIAWPKSQRWGSRHEYFSRPVRWLVALFGDEVIDFEFAGLQAGAQSHGHRFLAPGPFEVANADALLDVVRAAKVVPLHAEREAIIRDQVAAIEVKTGLKAELPPKTLVEVINLAEFPTAMVGTFDEEFLAVPEEIIVDAMLMHQRYFPLYDTSGKLTNKFIVVSNGDPAYTETIVDGNERVVRARLYDAKFFYDEDLKQPLEAYVPALADVVFQEKLGTVLDKTQRIENIVDHLAAVAELSAEDARDAKRAAYLAKADLVTGAVVEFTSVQGIMGSYYAEAAGETPQVAQAIAQHYQPKFAGDALPETVVGQLVAFADKLDTICGLFAIGQGPSGSSDPFAIRRSAIGIVNMLNAGLPVSLSDAISVALDNFTNIEFDKAAVQQEIEEFFITRARVMAQDAGHSQDVIEAVLAGGVKEPAEFAKRVAVLEQFRSTNTEALQDLSTAFARAYNLRDEAVGTDLNEAILEAVETELRDAIVAADAAVNEALAQESYEEALHGLAALREPIDGFFEAVMVMDEDPTKRANRLALLNRFVDVFASVADFSHLAK
ncbi:glycine--tRNA ligase subunit beta [Anaerotardibacter muris]|uniref:glycine--tRNA ligase subunit beta n=1 Tax=Anaerotardibacter muris TaxID=2941505 RepID=UPI00203E76DA|nr:glycine--tRNA ligase subunit beta [Anaerotardibacter muris]